jgi:NAD+ synthase
VNTQIVNWLKLMQRKCKVKGFVIGISGGVDSAVTSAKPLGFMNIEMPIHQHGKPVVGNISSN